MPPPNCSKIPGLLKDVEEAAGQIESGRMKDMAKGPQGCIGLSFCRRHKRHSRGPMLRLPENWPRVSSGWKTTRYDIRNIKPLAGPLKGWLRFRAGDYRVIYQIDSAKQTVYVVRIAHRKEAYE